MDNVSSFEPLWTVDDVAAYLNIPVKTLYDWRSRRHGPVGKRVGKYVRFRPADVVAWFESLDSGAA